MIKPELLSMLLSSIVAFVTIFGFFQGRMTNTERRLTILEEKDKQTDKVLEEYKVRLDNHDKQTEAMMTLIERVSNLTEKVDEVKQEVSQIRKEH